MTGSLSQGFRCGAFVYAGTADIFTSKGHLDLGVVPLIGVGTYVPSRVDRRLGQIDVDRSNHHRCLVTFVIDACACDRVILHLEVDGLVVGQAGHS